MGLQLKTDIENQNLMNSLIYTAYKMFEIK